MAKGREGRGQTCFLFFSVNEFVFEQNRSATTAVFGVCSGLTTLSNKVTAMMLVSVREREREGG